MLPKARSIWLINCWFLAICWCCCASAAEVSFDVVCVLGFLTIGVRLIWGFFFAGSLLTSSDSPSAFGGTTFLVGCGFGSGGGAGAGRTAGVGGVGVGAGTGAGGRLPGEPPGF